MMGKVFRTDYMALLYSLYAAAHLFVDGIAASPEFIFKWGVLLFVYVVCRVIVSPTVFLCLIVAGGIYEAVLGVLQIAGAAETASPLFGITGSFFNPGPYAGFLAIAVLSALSLGAICLRKKIKWYRALFAACVISALFMALMMIVANSRASILALVGGILWYLLCKYKDKVNWKHLLIGGVILSMVVVGLYLYRKGSANGRLLIWRVSADMVLDAPLFGHGIGSFDKEYIIWQGEYFRENPNSGYVQVAGYTKFPYNEFIHISAEQGAVGLVLLILMIFAVFYNNRKSKEYGAYLDSIIVGWMVFACFSYPAEVFLLKGVFAGLLGLSGRSDDEKSRVKYVFLGVAVVAVAFLGIEAHKWKREKREMMRVVAMMDRKKIGKEELADYVKENLDKLRREQYVYDRCVLGLSALCKDADEVEEYLDYVSVSCLNYCAIGDLYRRDGQLGVAEDYYLRAHNMIPTMITPMSALFKMYRDNGDSLKAEAYARKVLELPVKIENTKTIKARREAEGYMSR